MVELIWSPKSLKDLENIYEYIQPDSEINGRHFINQLIGATVTITQFPNSGRVVPEIEDEKYREKLYKDYRIIYRIQPEQVEIVTIQHQSKQLHKDIKTD